MTTERPIGPNTGTQPNNAKPPTPTNRVSLASGRQAATGLHQQFGVSQVLLFGLLARGLLFHAHSDIDLATYGLPEKSYLKALSYLLDLDVPFDFDLVRIEEATPRLLRDIERDGLHL